MKLDDIIFIFNHFNSFELIPLLFLSKKYYNYLCVHPKIVEWRNIKTISSLFEFTKKNIPNFPNKHIYLPQIRKKLNNVVKPGDLTKNKTSVLYCIFLFTCYPPEAAENMFNNNVKIKRGVAKMTILLNYDQYFKGKILPVKNYPPDYIPRYLGYYIHNLTQDYIKDLILRNKKNIVVLYASLIKKLAYEGRIDYSDLNHLCFQKIDNINEILYVHKNTFYKRLFNDDIFEPPLQYSHIETIVDILINHLGITTFDQFLNDILIEFEKYGPVFEKFIADKTRWENITSDTFFLPELLLIACKHGKIDVTQKKWQKIILLLVEQEQINDSRVDILAYFYKGMNVLHSFIKTPSLTEDEINGEIIEKCYRFENPENWSGEEKIKLGFLCYKNCQEWLLREIVDYFNVDCELLLRNIIQSKSKLNLLLEKTINK